MKELDPIVAKAIALIIKEQTDKLFVELDDAQCEAEKREEALRAEFLRLHEFWMLDADLWREQTKNKLHDIEQLGDGLSETCEHFQEEVLALQEQNAQLIDDALTVESRRLKPKGGFKPDTTYHEGDCVMRDGASWWCVVASTEKDPRDSDGEWRLLSMRGARGDKGDRGQRGEPGKSGTNGKDGASILDARVAGLNLAFAMSDGTAIHVGLDALRDTISEIVKSEVAAALKHKRI